MQITQKLCKWRKMDTAAVEVKNYISDLDTVKEIIEYSKWAIHPVNLNYCYLKIFRDGSVVRATFLCASLSRC
jgi:hypothetical protein